MPDLDPRAVFTQSIAEILRDADHDPDRPVAFYARHAEAVAEYAYPLVEAAADAEEAWHRGWVAHGKTCSIICPNAGPGGEPMACGYATGHDGAHSWASLPTFAAGERGA